MTTQPTSIDALNSVRANIPSMKDKVFDVIALHPDGIIAEDVEILLDARRSSITARINELVKERRVKDSGQRSETSSGRSAIMWVVDNTPAVAMAA